MQLFFVFMSTFLFQGDFVPVRQQASSFLNQPHSFQFEANVSQWSGLLLSYNGSSSFSNQNRQALSVEDQSVIDARILRNARSQIIHNGNGVEYERIENSLQMIAKGDWSTVSPRFSDFESLTKGLHIFNPRAAWLELLAGLPADGNLSQADGILTYQGQAARPLLSGFDLPQGEGLIHYTVRFRTNGTPLDASLTQNHKTIFTMSIRQVVRGNPSDPLFQIPVPEGASVIPFEVVLEDF